MVSAADKAKVSWRDGRIIEGEVRCIELLSDLAVVKIEGKNLPTALLGNSSELEVGDWAMPICVAVSFRTASFAIAVGNPLGLDSTVTLGIISTLDRPSTQVPR